MDKITTSKPAADNRTINNAIRLPGSRDERGIFHGGEVIKDVKRLAEVAAAGEVDLRELFERGAIDGTDWFPEAA